MGIAQQLQKSLPRVLRVHSAIYQKTNGRIGHTLFPGAPRNLLLHTVGAKSGAPRTATLSYAPDGDSYLIVASNGGSPKAPAWLHNLRAEPNVEINVGPRRFPVTATILTPADADYARVFELADSNNSGRYAAYQTKTTRPIPVVRLTPR